MCENFVSHNICIETIELWLKYFYISSHKCVSEQSTGKNYDIDAITWYYDLNFNLLIDFRHW